MSECSDDKLPHEDSSPGTPEHVIQGEIQDAEGPKVPQPELQQVQVIQSREKVCVRGLVKFIPAVASHFCLILPAPFSQPRTKTFSQLCRGEGVQRVKSKQKFCAADSTH